MTGRPLPTGSPFAADDGAPDPALAGLLAAFGAGAVGLDVVQPALLGVRLLVPVVVPPSGVDLPADDGGCGDGLEQLAGVTLAGRDGRRAQPAFTGLPALASWDPAARPMPVLAEEAARAVVAAGLDALVVDPSGPVRVVLVGGPLRALAEGRRWLPPAVDPDVVAAVGQSLTGVRGLVGVRMGAGEGCDLAVRLEVPAGFDAARARAVAEECGRRLARDPVVLARAPGGVDLAVHEVGADPDAARTADEGHATSI